MRRLTFPLLALTLLAGCRALSVPRDVASPADAPRCDPGLAGAVETGFQVAGRKTERSFRLVGHVLFESLLTGASSVVGLFEGGPRRAAAAWEHGAKNVERVARFRADQLEAAGQDLCARAEEPRPHAPPADPPPAR